MKKWPGWMPNPLVDGYGIRPVDRRAKTDMEINGVYRVEFDTDEAECTCSLILDQEESAWFESFERDILRHGSTWFEIPLWVGGEVQPHKVRFKDHPQAGNLIGVHTTYSLTFDVAERKLMCPNATELLLEFSPADVRSALCGLEKALNTVAVNGCTTLPDYAEEYYYGMQ